MAEREQTGSADVRATSTGAGLLLIVGLLQIVPAAIMILRPSGDAVEWTRLAWLGAPAVGGAAYVLLALPVRGRLAWAVRSAKVVSIGQAIVLGALALLSVVAAGRSGEPGSMTMGVIMFGTLACVHAFVAGTLIRAKPRNVV